MSTAQQEVNDAQPAGGIVPPEPSGQVIGDLMPNLDEAQFFLDLLEPNGQFTFQTFDDQKARGLGLLAKVFHGTLDQHAASLVSINRQGGGVFVMVNEGDGTLHPGERTCRTVKNVIRVRSVFIDLDGSPLEPVLKAKKLPSMIVESSPAHWHAYWLLDDCPLDKFRPTQVALAAKFAGDPKVNDLCRVLRLPGFFHQKNESFMTRIVDINKLKGE